MTCEICGYAEGHSDFCKEGLRHPRPNDPHGVPTGVVPRKPRYTCPFCAWAGSDDHAAWMEHACPQMPRRVVNHIPPAFGYSTTPHVPIVRSVYAPAIDRALDEYELMVRKARAWDELRGRATRVSGAEHDFWLAQMNAMITGPT